MGTRVTPSAIHFADKALAGVPRLLDDLQRLIEDRDTADIVFIVGREEVPIYAHRLIMRARCASFQNVKRGEMCKVPGSTVSPSPPGTPTPIRLPLAKPDVFREVLFYLYTGKVILQDCTVFETLSISQELGIEELRMCCEDHINSTLNVHNACTFLPAALEMENRVPGNKGGRSFADRCTAYIGENALECVQTSAFLNLSKEALIHLVSSDYLAMEEEDVWRAVLAWAKHQSGVTQPTAHWTEEERARITQQMSGVINHVRILLIDSQVFAEEVEPTGAVPMELSLERYRFAALPNKFSHSEDKRIQPRTSLKLFQGSQLLSGEKLHLQRMLNAWFGNSKQMWRLLYRASTHGYTAEAFHYHCDGHSPTFVIALGSHGELCGGFSDVPWGKTRGRGRYVPSDKAFLFTLINNSDVPPTKFDVVKKMFAIAHHPDYGPIFGAGADFCISHNCNANLESYSNLPHSYDGENASCTLLMGDYNFTVIDYEVFTTLGK
ncbi:BTB/POZ domain-containing protein 9 [Parasteatoda tepidariorum]|uniref:BTB/POZ domain-containing protein 9 n=1 Tax=Parasteatoda tepidariorum TaxID=114398 RepID=UPI000A2BFE2A|nr:BTB/POZ domain-containing protein 9 [Parasteatoda tepidariorum]XP_020999866.1 BTB/POZ domain-containing protein 9 [Parasteatoda tepidariorum]